MKSPNLSKRGMWVISFFILCSLLSLVTNPGSKAQSGPQPTVAEAPTSPFASPVPTYIPAVEPQGSEPPEKQIPAQVIIQFASNTTQDERASYVESVGGTVVENIESLDTIVVTVSEEVAQEPLPESPLVITSEPDYYVTALDDPAPVNDPRYAEQWALPAIGAPSAWAELSADAPKVTVAVIDSGICASHPDLAGRILNGWDFLENDAVPQDDFGHGCSVSGVIAANMNDGIGIAGVAPNAQIMPLRVLNASGVGSYSDVAAAIVYAADNGAQVINLSLGGSNSSTTLENAINYAISKGLIVVAAAGNSGMEGALYPAAYPDVVAVGSVDPNLQHSSFSNYGSQIDIWAPGRDVLSTKRDGSYGLVSGTSFAAPYVAGAKAIEIVTKKLIKLNDGLLFIGNPITEATLTAFIITPPEILTTQQPSTPQYVDSLIYPSFKWPWDSSENGNIKWTSGPHSWSKGGQLTAKISSTRGSGLDFAKGGQSFAVLAMAAGTVIKNQCGFEGLGCIVAIRHTVGGSVMIYAHLKPNANNTAPMNNIQEGVSYPQGQQIGEAGQSGNQDKIHLHIEFRDGASNCTAIASGIDGNDCGDISWAGNPVGWDGQKLVDNYYINGYFDSANFCGPGADCDSIFNYDGSAVRGAIAGPYINFPYSDNGIARHVEAFVHPNFTCSSTTNCEINASDGTTVFADQGKFSGGGGSLYSTNSNNNPSQNDNTPPTGSWGNPSNGATISSQSVTLTVNVNDTGGSGVREVRWSAKWGGNWYGVGTDNSSPYSLSWNMCNSGVPNGDVELGFEVWDNANNKWVYSENGHSNIHITKNYTCNQTSNDTTPPTGSWTSPGNNSTINSSTVTLSVNASDKSGGSGVKEVRWSAKWNNQWFGVGNDGSSPYSIDWNMCSSGVPNGNVELGFEVWDNANNKWVYSEHSTNYHINKNSDCGGNTGGGDPLAGGPWNTQAWQNRFMAGFTNWEGTFSWGTYPYISFDWGTGAPFGWGGNEFSMKLWRNVYFPGGYYSFMSQHDDGIKVYLDGNLIIDAWWDGSGGHDAGRNVSEGYHEVRVEYYENQGDAKLQLVWYGPGYPAPDNNPPDGRITSPSNNSASNASDLTISADAWDDASGVDHVDFYAYYCLGSCTWRLINTDYSAPYTINNWGWSVLSDQRFWFKIDIYDKTGKVRYDAGGLVQVDLDRVNPTASITSPSVNSYLSTSQITINASANDDRSGVQKVQFFAGYNETTGAGAQGVIEPPLPEGAQAASSDITAQDYWHEIGWDENGSDGWSLAWNAASVPDQGGVALFIYAYDKAGNYRGTQVWPVLLDRVLPTSVVNALPIYNSSTSVVVSWTGSDATSGIAKYDIQYQDNGGSWTNWLSNTTLTSSTFTGTIGHTYAFRSRARDRAGNVEAWPISADTQITLITVPSNNNFSSALVISTVPYNHTVDSRGATIATDDPTPTCGYGKNSNSIWYKYTAPTDGILEIGTFGSNFDTVIAVWKGAQGNLTQVDCNDDTYESLESWLEEIPVTANTTYYIEVMDYGYPGGGNLELYIGFAKSIFNNDFNSPKLIASNTFSITSDSRGATQASDDPALVDCNRLPGQASIWYKFIPSRDGHISIDTRGSDYDTMLAVWSGARGNLVPIGCNDDIGAGDTDSIIENLRLSEDITYYIEVSQYDGKIDVDGASATELQDKPSLPNGDDNSASSLQDQKNEIDKNGGLITGLQGSRTDDISAQFWGGLLQLHSKFTPDPIIPSGPILRSPQSDIVTTDTTPDFSWTAVRDSQSYEIEFATNDSFTNVVRNTIISDEIYSPPAFSDGKYFWHVRGYDANNQPTLWSRVSNFTIDTTGPPAPILDSPANGVSTSRSIIFKWLASNTAVSYEFQYDNNSNFSSPEYMVKVPGNFRRPPAMKNGTYYWHVRAVDASGNWSGWSSARIINITARSLVGPLLLLPSDTSGEIEVQADETPINTLKEEGVPVDTSGTPTFTWEGVANAVNYQIQVDNNEDFESPELDETNDTTSQTLIAFLNSGLYHWRVRAIDPDGLAGEWSKTWRVIIDRAPDVPTLLLPVNNPDINLSGGMPTFSWESVTDGITYQIQVDNDADFSSPEFDNISADISRTLITPLENGTYYWHVRALNIYGTSSEWSTTWIILVSQP